MCVYAIIDPASQSCTLSAAGHLPPVLAMPDGTTRVPDLPGGQSLGLGSAVYGQARIKFPPGAIIALYTDGLTVPGWPGWPPPGGWWRPGTR
jgi:serine phosphatase RsbU (regulator of sigma subunit)